MEAMTLAQKEAQEYLRSGHDRFSVVHFINNDFSGESGISSPISFDEVSRGGYISDYFSLELVSDQASWDDGFKY